MTFGKLNRGLALSKAICGFPDATIDLRQKVVFAIFRDEDTISNGGGSTVPL